MQAYGPLACKLFGADWTLRSLLVSFMRSLVISRLLCNMHTLTMTTVAVRVGRGVMRLRQQLSGHSWHS